MKLKGSNTSIASLRMGCIGLALLASAAIAVVAPPAAAAGIGQGAWVIPNAVSDHVIHVQRRGGFARRGGAVARRGGVAREAARSASLRWRGRTKRIIRVLPLPASIL